MSAAKMLCAPTDLMSECKNLSMSVTPSWMLPTPTLTPSKMSGEYRPHRYLAWSWHQPRRQMPQFSRSMSCSLDISTDCSRKTSCTLDETGSNSKAASLHMLSNRCLLMLLVVRAFTLAGPRHPTGSAAPTREKRMSDWRTQWSNF